MLSQLPGHSRVWIFQNARPFDATENEQIHLGLDQFLSNWQAHGSALFAGAEVYKDQVIIVAVNEAVASASGCSIDGFQRFMQRMSEQLELDLFDRNQFLWLDNGELRKLNGNELNEKYAAGELNDQSIFIDQLTPTLADVRSALTKPLGSFWLKKMIR